MVIDDKICVTCLFFTMNVMLTYATYKFEINDSVESIICLIDEDVLGCGKG